MALSGTINKDFGGGYRIQIEWTATQNISANTSTITAKFYLISLGSCLYQRPEDAHYNSRDPGVHRGRTA